MHWSSPAVTVCLLALGGCGSTGEGDVDPADFSQAFPDGAVEAAEVVAWVRIADPVLNPCAVPGCATDEVLAVEVIELLKGTAVRQYVALTPTREHRNSIHMLGNGQAVDALLVAPSANVLLGDGVTLAYEGQFAHSFEFSYLHPAPGSPRQLVLVNCLNLLGYNGREPSSTNQAGKTLSEQMLENTTCNYPLDRAMEELQAGLQSM